MNTKDNTAARTKCAPETVPHKRNTIQKQIILETLKEMNSHVSAGAIYRQIQQSHPEIGRATVFRVLADMAENGDLLRFHVAGSEDRFDITSAPHCHIRCRQCGKVNDVWFGDTDIDSEILRHITSSSGFQTEDVHLEFTGLCNECK